MKTEEITSSIAKFDAFFRSSGEAMTEKERIFSRIIKLNEEVGELCEAVLATYDTNQRPKDKEIDVDKELADVLIYTLLLAHNRKKDIWKEVEAKIQTQLNRFEIT